MSGHHTFNQNDETQVKEQQTLDCFILLSKDRKESINNALSPMIPSPSVSGILAVLTCSLNLSKTFCKIKFIPNP